jgi:hypothetical protein
LFKNIIITNLSKQEVSNEVFTHQEELQTGSKLDLFTSSLSEINSDENKKETEWKQFIFKTIKKSTEAKLQPTATLFKTPG